MMSNGAIATFGSFRREHAVGRLLWASWLTAGLLACSPPGEAGGGGGSPSASGGAGDPAGGSSTGSSTGGLGETGGSSGSGAGGLTTGGSGGAISLPSGGAANGGSGGGPEQEPLRVLLFSRTAEYRHEAIPVAIRSLEGVAEQRGWTAVATEDAATFDDGGLADFDVVVFLMTTGDVLSTDQEAALERFVRSGKGYVGVHSASDTEYDWPWYGRLVGAYFLGHGDIQEAMVHVDAEDHPALAEVPEPWLRTDEWYGFQTNPREQVDVLLRVDETSFSPGAGAMGEDHPIAWCHEFDGGRSFYTALGHTAESYADSTFLAHLSRGIEWAAGGP